MKILGTWFNFHEKGWSSFREKKNKNKRMALHNDLNKLTPG